MTASMCIVLLPTMIGRTPFGQSNTEPISCHADGRSTSIRTCSADAIEQTDGRKIQSSLANIRIITIQTLSLAERFGIMIMQFIIPLRSEYWLSSRDMLRFSSKLVSLASAKIEHRSNYI